MPGALAGGVAAAIVALVVGWPLMRLSGVSASIATFAILVVANVVFGNWTAVTGGQNSLMGLPAYVDLWTALGWAVAAIVIAFVYQETRSALLLARLARGRGGGAGVRRQRRAPPADRFRHFRVSCPASPACCSAHFLGIVRVENFYLDLTFLIVAMLIIGGRGSLTGAVAGALVIAVLTELLRQTEIGFQVGKTTIAAPPGIGDVILALIMLLIILFRPNGIGRRAGADLAFRAKLEVRPDWATRSAQRRIISDGEIDPFRRRPVGMFGRGFSAQARRRSRRHPCRTLRSAATRLPRSTM